MRTNFLENIDLLRYAPPRSAGARINGTMRRRVYFFGYYITTQIIVHTHTNTFKPRLYLPAMFSGNNDLFEHFEIIQRLARTKRHSRERIFGNRDRQAGFLPQKTIQVFKKRPTACQNDSPINDIGR